ncbi:autotransporter outer membrane beta-barrel domain-containing protein [Endozoicomonas elysicola]|uniref:Autotransporter domain-containing protein n=1 Tax=Endozoicomonas elysicola TaxID=305900 RepID=A0A081KFQ9_9GAMM|nr:autotransporter outer membrane beta-barrel domain-containing protein [Endozoicomonas elysicola]KEI72985.1 hypothetical protein GV64_21700 [Endozoicomonas elysicola]
MNLSTTCKKAYLAIAISSVISSWVSCSYAVDLEPITELTVNTTISSEDRVYNDSGHAVDLSGSGTTKTLTNNGIIQSDNDTTIRLTDGKKLNIAGSGSIIGGIVNSEKIALDARGEGDTLGSGKVVFKFDSGAMVSGNIYFNPGSESQLTTSNDSTLTFDGKLIDGVEKIRLREGSNLILSAQNESINFNFDGINDSGGFFVEGSTITLSIGEGLDKDDAILIVNDLIEFSSVDEKNSSLVVTGDITESIGTKVLIQAEQIEGFSEDMVTSSGLFLSVSNVQLSESDSHDSITADVSYNEGVTADDFSAMASAGGADATEASVIKSFADIALDGTEITSTTISFNSSHNEEIANLLNGATDEVSASRLAGELTPDRSGAIIQAIHTSQNLQLDDIDNRVSLIRSGQESTGFWFGIDGYQGEKDVDSRIDGYDINGFSTRFGIDKKYSEEGLTGIAASINRQEVETKVYDTNYTIDSFQLSLYGNLNFDKYFISNSINAGYNAFNSTRKIGESTGYNGEVEATGDFSAYNIGWRITTGLDYNIGDVSIQPLVSGELNYLFIQNYTESGSPASLEYDKETLSQVKIGAGINISRQIKLESGKLIPSFTAMGWHDFNASERDINTNSITTPSTGIDINTATGASKNRFNAQAAINYKANHDSAIGITLGHQVEENYSDTMFNLEYRHNF